ncbi:MAG: hypothetical protein R2883_08295 [Caldisericia bacterium]
MEKYLEKETPASSFLGVYNDKVYYSYNHQIFIVDLFDGEILQILDDKEYIDGITSIIGGKLIAHAKIDDMTEMICATNTNTLKTEWTFEYPLFDHRDYSIWKR